MDAATLPSRDAKPKWINGKIVWSGGPSIKQFFALPESIMFYIAKNPSTSDVYLKLIQSCKYFFENNPILVAKKMFDEYLCPNDWQDCENNDQKCCIKINDITKIKSKIWLTRGLHVYNPLEDQIWTIPNFTSLLRPKIYECEIRDLQLHSQTVFFDDFKILASSAEAINLFNVKITNNDGTTVMLEAIFGALSNVKCFYLSFEDDISMLNATTLKKIVKLKNFGLLNSFSLVYIPEIFTVEELSVIIKDWPNIYFYFYFNTENGFSQGYKNQVDALIDTIIESQVPNRHIQYDGQDEEKHMIMTSRCEGYDADY